MSEPQREWKHGDRVILACEIVDRESDTEPWFVVNVGDEHDGYTTSLRGRDLIPDDRHRTPIAPEDVREGDVVRIEWEDEDGPNAREGAVYVSALGDLCTGGIYVDHPGRTVYLLHRATTERDKWWPPQPGDTISDGVGRVTRGKSDEWRLNPDHPDFYRRQTQVLWTDADVPDDAVLILPAQTRERIVPGRRLTVGEVWAANDRGGRDE